MIRLELILGLKKTLQLKKADPPLVSSTGNEIEIAGTNYDDIGDKSASITITLSRIVSGCLKCTDISITL